MIRHKRDYADFLEAMDNSRLPNLVWRKQIKLEEDEYRVVKTLYEHMDDLLDNGHLIYFGGDASSSFLVACSLFRFFLTKKDISGIYVSLVEFLDSLYQKEIPMFQMLNCDVLLLSGQETFDFRENLKNTVQQVLSERIKTRRTTIFTGPDWHKVSNLWTSDIQKAVHEFFEEYFRYEQSNN